MLKNRYPLFAFVAVLSCATPALAQRPAPVTFSGVAQPVSGPATDAQLRATPLPVTIISTSIAAATPVPLTAITNSAQTVIAAAKVLDSVACDNPNTTLAYLQFYNTTGAVTVGTAVTYFLAYPGNNAAAAAGTADRAVNLNINFSNGIKVAAATAPTGNSAPSVALNCSFGYR